MSLITVVIPTSEIPSHPIPTIISRAVESLKEQLPDAPIIVTCDGPRGCEQYDSYCNMLPAWKGETVIIEPPPARIHQSGMLCLALDRVRTPLLLYWEHDWELLPDVPWSELCELIERGAYNYIKLHAAPRIHPLHEHLMVTRTIHQHGGVGTHRYYDSEGGRAIPIVQTLQWSQNPHLASTDFYRKTILPLCEGKRDFIENIVHGIVTNSPWQEFKCGIYNPCDGDMMRVRHLDGKNSK
jgi:hypothetical protein